MSTVPIDRLADQSDHELLLQLKWEMSSIREQLTKALTQLDRGNQRFERISLKEQETAAALAALRGDFSRSMLESGEAKRIAAASERKAAEIEGTLKTWKSYLRIALAVIGTLQLVLLPLVIEVLKRWIFP